MQTIESYDAVPYESFAVPESHPDHLACLARLLGVEAAPPEACRVLELGAAAGGNLIPMAWGLPGSELVGVELSAEQARRGQGMIAGLGLANVRLLHQDILAVDDTQAPFDYILAHGVYSWVPEAVKEQILALCGRLLAPHGVAYLSWNVLPGWHARAMVRDLLLDGCAAAGDAQERLARARALLERLHRGLADDPRPVAAVLRSEVEYLRSARGSYLYHEYLEDTNTPETLPTFLARAARHGLRYLGEARLHSMFASTLPAAAQAVLEDIEGQTGQEALMDALTLRPFRQTLLVHREVEPALELDLDRLSDYGLFADLHPLAPPLLDRVEPQTYATGGGERFTLEQPLTKALVELLAKAHPNALTLAAALPAARERIVAAGAAGPATDLDACQLELFNLYASQGLGLTLRTTSWPNRPGERPRAHALARAQAAFGEGHAATVRHRSLDLDPLAARLLTLLDGTRDRSGLESALLPEVRREPALAGTADAGRLETAVAAAVERLLAVFARNGLLLG
jgi:SAM-dependent methyltransferase